MHRNRRVARSGASLSLLVVVALACGSPSGAEQSDGTGGATGGAAGAGAAGASGGSAMGGSPSGGSAGGGSGAAGVGGTMASAGGANQGAGGSGAGIGTGGGPGGFGGTGEGGIGGRALAVEALEDCHAYYDVIGQACEGEPPEVIEEEKLGCSGIVPPFADPCLPAFREVMRCAASLSTEQIYCNPETDRWIGEDTSSCQEQLDARDACEAAQE